MADELRRRGYVEGMVLMETERILDAQFKSTILEVTGAQLEILRNLTAYPNRRESFVSEYHPQYYLIPTDAEWDNLLAIVANLEERLMLIYVDDYVCLRDKKAQNVVGGTFQSGAWRTRDVNDEQADDAGICSLDANQITLVAGTYRCAIACIARQVDRHLARLYDVTGDALLVLGMAGYAAAGVSSHQETHIGGEFALSVQSILEIQHWCQSTHGTYGFGVPTNLGEEIYLIAEFWRMIG